MNLPNFVKIKRYWSMTELNGICQVINVYEYGIIRYTFTTRDADEVINHLYSNRWGM